jgi:hypothetical protein
MDSNEVVTNETLSHLPPVFSGWVSQGLRAYLKKTPFATASPQRGNQTGFRPRDPRPYSGAKCLVALLCVGYGMRLRDGRLLRVKEIAECLQRLQVGKGIVSNWRKELRFKELVLDLRAGYVAFFAKELLRISTYERHHRERLAEFASYPLELRRDIENARIALVQAAKGIPTPKAVLPDEMATVG